MAEVILRRRRLERHALARRLQQCSLVSGRLVAAARWRSRAHPALSRSPSALALTQRSQRRAESFCVTAHWSGALAPVGERWTVQRLRTIRIDSRYTESKNLIV
jgi:hypothetical protein